jgi:hypothetical protein
MNKSGIKAPMCRNATVVGVACEVIDTAAYHSSFIPGQQMLIAGGQVPSH